MSTVKCLQCDGLGYHYNQSTFQSEHCPHCEGKGVFEVHTAPVIDETKVETSKPIAEENKKTAKRKVDEPIVIEDRPEVEVPSFPELTTSGSL
jgi:DnaJ-class molecular chaperone